MALQHDLTADSVAAYVGLFVDPGVLAGPGVRWYRGEGRLRLADALLPSIARPPLTPTSEWSVYQRFRQNASAFLPHANLTEWDWMLYMRHFGAPTRLLDWTESPLVALYFAVERTERDADDGAVWCLSPWRLNELAGFERRIYAAGIDEEFNVYTPTEVRNSPAAAAANYKPAALIAPRSFPRLVAQQGVFTVVHRQATPIDAIADDQLLSLIRIPAASKSSIRNSLRTLGMNRLSMYPELQSVAASQ